jgi:hypothetical protein
MKKAAILVAAIAALSSTAVIAPAQARGLHHVGGVAVAAAVAAGVAADAYANGYGPYGYYAPGYIYAPGYVVYGPGIYHRGLYPY